MISKFYTLFYVAVVCCTTLNGISSEATGVTTGVRSRYNESCNKTVRCKSQSWLTCDSDTHTCQCARPEEMTYDLARAKCVALIGERCKFGFDEDDEGFGANSWYGKADCVQGAVCGPSGTCSCPNGFYEDQLINRCLAVKSYGDKCGQRFECNQDKFLNCVDGQCSCDEDNAVYNLEGFNTRDYNYNYYTNVPAGVCIGRVGTRCSASEGKFCVRNSYCSSSGRCTCDDSYTETSDKLCGLGYNQACSDLTICSDKLRCSSTKFLSGSYSQEIKCQCPFPKYQIYESSSCKGLIGGPCDPNDSTSCVTNATCIEEENMFRCECGVGFVENLNGKCEIAHGFPCEYISQLTESQLCDRKADLRCKNKKCACEDEADIYEPIRRQCSTPVGIRCLNDSQCVSNAWCRKKLDQIFGRCSCSKEYEVTKNHGCALIEVVNLNIGLDDDELNTTTTQRPTVTATTVKSSPVSLSPADYSSSSEEKD